MIDEQSNDEKAIDEGKSRKKEKSPGRDLKIIDGYFSGWEECTY